jgi:hypothetical protein
MTDKASDDVAIQTEAEATIVIDAVDALDAAVEGKADGGQRSDPIGSFDVGQVVYILLREEPQIFPAIVSGQNLKRTLEGSVYSWELTVGATGPKSKTYDSKKIPGDVYGSIDEVFAVMMQRFESFAVDMCSDAKRKADEWYPPQHSTAPLSSQQFLSDMNTIQAPHYPQSNQQFNPMMMAGTPQQRFVNKYVDPELLKRDK